jgi:hypothetical protein
MPTFNCAPSIPNPFKHLGESCDDQNRHVTESRPQSPVVPSRVSQGPHPQAGGTAEEPRSSVPLRVMDRRGRALLQPPAQSPRPGSNQSLVPGRHSSLRASGETRRSQLSLSNVSVLNDDGKKTMVEKGTELRGELAMRAQSGNFGGFGEAIKTEDGQILAIRVNPERMQDFRCLLQAAKDEMTVGANNVLLRTPEGYDGCQLFVSKDGMAGLGVTQDGTVISVYKTGAKSPKEGERHRMPDLLRAAVKEAGGDHLACLAHLVPFYSQYGFDVAGVIPLPPHESTPGWNEKDTKDFAKQIDAWKVDTEQGEVKLPLVLMRVNPERFDVFDATGKAPKETLDSSIFEGKPHFVSAVAAYEGAAAMREAEAISKGAESVAEDTSKGKEPVAA